MGSPLVSEDVGRYQTTSVGKKGERPHSECTAILRRLVALVPTVKQDGWGEGTHTDQEGSKVSGTLNGYRQGGEEDTPDGHKSECRDQMETSFAEMVWRVCGDEENDGTTGIWCHCKEIRLDCGITKASNNLSKEAGGQRGRCTVAHGNNGKDIVLGVFERLEECLVLELGANSLRAVTEAPKAGNLLLTIVEESCLGRANG